MLAAVCGLAALLCGCDKSDPIQVSEVTLDVNVISLVPGETRRLTATVSPDNAEYDAVVWSNSEVSVKVEYKIVDAGTLNPTYSGQTALVLTLTPSPAAEHWYVGAFKDDLSGYNDATIIEALQAKGYKDKKELALIVKEGQSYTIAAVAVDPGGTAGALTKLDVKIGSGTRRSE